MMDESVSPNKSSVILSLTFLLLLSISLHNVAGRKCVCSSKACQEAGVEVCRTRFFCYTEVLYDVDGSFTDSRSTRGCTEGATPLLCETNAWTRLSKRGSKEVGSIANQLDGGPANTKLQMFWPRLKCCKSADYCNSVTGIDHEAKNNRQIEQSTISSINHTRLVHPSESSENANETDEPFVATSEFSINDGESNLTKLLLTDVKESKIPYGSVGQSIRLLHVAVFFLAIAALISVLGACYVITMFANLPSPMDNSNSLLASSVFSTFSSISKS